MVLVQVCITGLYNRSVLEISYMTNNGKFVNFHRGQDLAKGMVHFIKHQRIDVPAKCMEILLSTLNIYLSLVVGVVV